MLTTIDDVIYEANLINIAEEEVIAAHLDTASLIVKRLIGNDLYEQITSEKISDTIRFQEVKKAETNYAISFVLMSLSIITTGNGIVTRFDSSKSGEYNLNPDQVNILIEHYKTLAEQLIAPYILGGELNCEAPNSSSISAQVTSNGRRISSL
jgi:hypothetical protein